MQPRLGSQNPLFFPRANSGLGWSCLRAPASDQGTPKANPATASSSPKSRGPGGDKSWGTRVPGLQRDGGEGQRAVWDRQTGTRRL